MLTEASTTRLAPEPSAFPAAAAAKLLGVKIRTIKAAGLNFNTRADVESWLQNAPAEALSFLIRLDQAPPRPAR